jgi:replicative DNA helicase
MTDTAVAASITAAAPARSSGPRGAQQHGDIVLAAVIGGTGSTKALDFIGTKLTPEHFPDKRQQDLLKLLARYAAQTHGIMGRAALEDFLRDKAPGSRLDLVAYYDLLAAAPMPTKDQFVHSVGQLAELAADRDTGDVLAAGLEILRHGVQDSLGAELRGHADARLYVSARLAEVERDLHLSDSPEGDARDDADDVLASYAHAKALRASGQVPGVLFGIPALDAYVEGGIGPGEMALLLSWTSVGKSRLCVQHAWDAAVEQGKNVVYFTTETLRPDICRALVARHSRLPKFGLAEGLNDRKIRAGALTPAEEQALAAVIDDFKYGPYGRLRVVQMPEHCTMSGLSGRFEAISRMFTPELVIADYLQLFIPERQRRDGSEREDQSGILKSAKRWCASCLGGKGVPFVTPWQVNKTGRQSMKASGVFELEDAHGTSEAAKTPDLVLALMDEEDTSGGRNAPLRIKALKVRGGPRGQSFPLLADYATCYFHDRDEPDEVGLELEGADA